MAKLNYISAMLTCPFIGLLVILLVIKVWKIKNYYFGRFNYYHF